MTIDSADDSKISNWTINTNRISNQTYDSKSNHEASQLPTIYVHILMAFVELLLLASAVDSLGGTVVRVSDF